MRALTLAVLLVFASVTPQASASPIILSNLTALDPFAGGPDIARVTSAFRFVAPTTAWLTDVTIWSTEEPFNNRWNGTAEWSIFPDAGNNQPAAVPGDSGIGLNPTRTFLSQTHPSASLYRQYTFTLDHPTLLEAGTAYWFSPRFPGELIAWAGVVPGISGSVVQRQIGETEWLLVGDATLGFELRGQDLAAIPEPASLVLLGTGVASLLLRRHRRSPGR